MEHGFPISDHAGSRADFRQNVLPRSKRFKDGNGDLFDPDPTHSTNATKRSERLAQTAPVWLISPSSTDSRDSESIRL